VTQISKNFYRSEFACNCGCGFDTVDATLLRVVQDVRKHFNAKVRVTSGCRCETHNANEGGSKNSQHLFGRAADIQVEGVDPALVAQYLEKYHPTVSIGRYETFTHVDTRTNGPARWTG